jgi:serine/threonine protein kinase
MSKVAMVEKEMIEMALLEKDIMFTNKHPNLIKMYWVFQTSNILYFVMPLIQGGELY